MGDSPTTRSLDRLKKRGWTSGIVERRCGKYVTVDLWGFVDIVAMKQGEIPVLIQTTTGSNIAARRTKIYASDLAADALQSGFRIVLHGWRQLKVKRGGKKVVWTLKEEEVTLAQIMSARAAASMEAMA